MQQNLLANEDFCCPFKHRIILLPIHQDQHFDTNKPKIHYLARKQGGTKLCMDSTISEIFPLHNLIISSQNLKEKVSEVFSWKSW